MTTVHAVVVDFGFTLCSEHYFNELGPEMSERASQILFGAPSEMTSRWTSGMDTPKEVSVYLSGFLEISPESLHAALVSGSSEMRSTMLFGP